MRVPGYSQEPILFRCKVWGFKVVATWLLPRSVSVKGYRPSHWLCFFRQNVVADEDAVRVCARFRIEVLKSCCVGSVTRRCSLQASSKLDVKQEFPEVFPRACGRPAFQYGPFHVC